MGRRLRNHRSCGSTLTGIARRSPHSRSLGKELPCPARLHLDVFVVPYKPIVGLIAPMGAGEATWPATAVSLISGERDAVLIDAVLTPQDAGRVVDWIRATGKNLTTIYITHGHGDHFFGLNTILDAFPDARAVTAAAVVPDA